MPTFCPPPAPEFFSASVPYKDGTLSVTYLPHTGRSSFWFTDSDGNTRLAVFSRDNQKQWEALEQAIATYI